MNQQTTNQLDLIITLVNSDADPKEIAKAYDKYKELTTNI